jgi:hypothetical protein
MLITPSVAEMTFVEGHSSFVARMCLFETDTLDPSASVAE